MTRRFYCTYFDKNYLVRGIALIRSLNRHAEDFTLFVVCLDDLTLDILGRLNLPNIVLVSVHDIEHGDAALSAARGNRSIVEYYWTLTPSIIFYLLTKNKLDQLTYLDSDLFFFSCPKPIFQEFGDNSILIHGHRFSQSKKHLEIHGTYNVGLMVFRNDQNGIACLEWWRDRCNEWCYARVEDGKYADQLYLNHFPTNFDKVHVLQHPGAGLAPWNHEQYRVSDDASSGNICVNGQPLIFYHFHALKFYHPNIIFPIIGRSYDFPKEILDLCYLPYMYALNEAIALVLRTAGDFKFGLYDTAFYDAPFVATKYRHADIARILGRNLKNSDWYSLDKNWNCYNTRWLRKSGPDIPNPNDAMPAPRISIVTPSYNQGAYLEECIKSVLGQGYSDLEYVIMDGGSTDGSLEIIKKYEKHLAYWQSCPDDGQYPAINDGFTHCSGDIMTWINADDRLHPGALHQVAAIFSQNPQVQWLTGRPNGIDAKGNQAWVMPTLPMWDRQRFLLKSYKNPFIQQEGTFWRRELWQKAGGHLDTGLKLAGDLELWSRFFRHAQLFSVDSLLAAFRSHAGQKTREGLDHYCREADKVLDSEIQHHPLENSSQRHAPMPISRDQLQRYMAQFGFAKDCDGKSNASRHSQNHDASSKDFPDAYMVSAIVSTYNAQAYIRGCLEDLLAQSIADQVEIIVIDSASSQNEAATVKAFQKRHANIKYIRTAQRESVYAAWNRGIKIAEGKYITNANTDDRHRRDALERMVEVLEANSDIDLVYADVLKTRTPHETFDRCTPAGVLRWYDWDRRVLLEKGCFIGPQPLWRRKVHDVYGYFNEDYRVCGDYEFWLRISQSSRFFHVPEPLGLYLDRPGSVEHANHDLKLREEAQISAMYRDAAAKGRIIGRIAGEGVPSEGHPGYDSSVEETNLENNHHHDDSRMASKAQGGLIMLSPETILNAIRYLDDGEHSDAACWCLDKLIADYPGMASAHGERAQMAYSRGEIATAQKHFELAAQLAPDQFDVLKNLGDFRYSVQKDPDGAIQTYEQALALCPNHVETLTLAGHVAVSMEQFEKARVFYTRVQAVEPENTQIRPYLDKVQQLLSDSKRDPKFAEDPGVEARKKASEGDIHGAVALLRTSVANDPDDALAHNDLGVLYYELGETDRALEHYEKAAGLQPGNGVFQKNLADLYWVAKNDARKAFERYIDALKIDPRDVESLLGCGRICLETGKLDDANSFLNCILELEPWNQDARQLMTHIEDMRRDFQPAPVAAQEVYLAQDLSNPGSGEVARAIDDLLEELAKSPQDAKVLNDLGVRYFESGDKEKALSCYEQAVALQPDDSVFAKNLADFYLMEQSRIQDAMQLYNRVLEDDPEDIDCLSATGLICTLIGNKEDARHFYQRVLEIEPWNQTVRAALDNLGYDHQSAGIDFQTKIATA